MYASLDSSRPTDGALSTRTSDVDDTDDDAVADSSVGCDRAANNGRVGAAIAGGADIVGDVSSSSTVPVDRDALLLLLLLLVDAFDGFFDDNEVLSSSSEE